MDRKPPKIHIVTESGPGVAPSPASRFPLLSFDEVMREPRQTAPDTISVRAERMMEGTCPCQRDGCDGTLTCPPVGADTDGVFRWAGVRCPTCGASFTFESRPVSP